MPIEKPTTSDKIAMAAYILVTIGLGLYLPYIHDTDSYRQIVFFYGFMSPFFLYAVSAESGSKLTLFLFWLVVGICHWVIYLHLKDNPDLNMGKLNVAAMFKYTLPFAFLFQLLRIASYKLQGSDLRMIYRGGNPTATVVDYVAFFLFMGTILLFSLI